MMLAAACSGAGTTTLGEPGKMPGGSAAEGGPAVDGAVDDGGGADGAAPRGGEGDDAGGSGGVEGGATSDANPGAEDGAAPDGAAPDGASGTGSGDAGACMHDADCGKGKMCGFKTADGCTAVGQCFEAPAPGSPQCDAYELGCTCSGGEINLVCNGYPSGYASQPVAHSGSCAAAHP
jgi:hypothetical protein